jgi:DNA-binding HxlR family transcriptional regulator
MPHAVDGSCRAFQSAVEVLSRPWNALILNALQGRPLRFSEVAAMAEGVTDKVLSARLKELERRGLLIRTVDPGPPVRVAYALTDAGRGFHKVARAIETWGSALR